jgi:hypothetical protein
LPNADKNKLGRAAALLGVALLGAMGERARADGVPIGAPGTTGTLTHYEAFVLTSCTPCMRESYSAFTLPVATTKAPEFPRSAGVAPGMTRAGEVEFAVLRAYPPGHAAREQLAMRVTLSVTTGLQGQTYLLGAGLVDESDVPGIAAALAELAHAADSVKSGADMSDLEVHGDNLRIGIVRTHDEPLVYIQAWSSVDLPRLALKQVWEVPGLYLPLSDLSALQRGLAQVGDKIRQMRARRCAGYSSPSASSFSLPAFEQKRPRRRSNSRSPADSARAMRA